MWQQNWLVNFIFFFEKDPILLGRVTRGIELTGNIVINYMVKV